MGNGECVVHYHTTGGSGQGGSLSAPPRYKGQWAVVIIQCIAALTATNNHWATMRTDSIRQPRIWQICSSHHLDTKQVCYFSNILPTKSLQTGNPPPPRRPRKPASVQPSLPCCSPPSCGVCLPLPGWPCHPHTAHGQAAVGILWCTAASQGAVCSGEGSFGALPHWRVQWEVGILECAATVALGGFRVQSMRLGYVGVMCLFLLLCTPVPCTQSDDD